MSKKYFLLILLTLGLLTRFMFFGHPNETVFDEVHFGKFISGYYTHEYFFDIHPPLGKLMIAGFARAFNFRPEFAFGEIGEAYPDKQYMILRFLPSLAGALLPAIIFLLAMEMGLAPLYAFMAGIFIVFENAILTQSMFILMDAFLLLFGFASLLSYFKYKNGKGIKYLYIFAIFAGFATSIKWTGVGFLGLPLLIELATAYKSNWRRLMDIFSAGIIAFILYFCFFAIHLSVLDKSGPGDAFMSPGFQKTLTGSKLVNSDGIEASSIFQKFTELNVEMYNANQRLNAEHPYSSQWYTWPFMKRSIYYWVNGEARIYLIGNPVIWWLSAITLIFILANYISDPKNSAKNHVSSFLVTAYVVNLLPFIGVKRVMFLYHYFTALIFTILMVAYVLNKNKSSWKLVTAIIALSVIAFVYFAPLNYGLKLSPKAYESRVWFESWR